MPTGSPLSTLISYFIHSEMFDQLDKLSRKHNLPMTVYVDDVVFSGRKISKAFRDKAKLIIHRRGLRSHKYRYYSNNKPKEITGVIIKGNQLLLPQRRHLSLYEQLVDLWNSHGNGERQGIFRRALSRVSEGAQIDEQLGNRKRALMAAKPNIFGSATANDAEKKNNTVTGHGIPRCLYIATV